MVRHLAALDRCQVARLEASVVLEGSDLHRFVPAMTARQALAGPAPIHPRQPALGSAARSREASAVVRPRLRERRPQAVKRAAGRAAREERSLPPPHRQHHRRSHPHRPRPLRVPTHLRLLPAGRKVHLHQELRRVSPPPAPPTPRLRLRRQERVPRLRLVLQRRWCLARLPVLGHHHLLAQLQALGRRRRPARLRARERHRRPAALPVRSRVLLGRLPRPARCRAALGRRRSSDRDGFRRLRRMLAGRRRLRRPEAQPPQLSPRTSWRDRPSVRL